MGYVNQRKDPHTNRDWILTVNKSSLLTGLQKEFEEMERAFFNILESIELPTPRGKFQYLDCISLLGKILLIFRYIVEEYFYRILMDWPGKSSDSVLLARAQQIFFSRISKIMSKIQQLVSSIGNGPDHAKNLSQMYMQLVPPMTILSPHLIRNMVETGKSMKIESQVNGLLDYAWKLLYRSHYGKVQAIDFGLVLVRGWREYLGRRFDNYPAERKILSSIS